MVLFALVLVAVLAMGGLLIDTGVAWGHQRQAQTAADTAALAAVKAYAAQPDTATRAQRLVAAIAAAKWIAGRNGFPAGSVSCPGDPAVQGVTVNNPPAATAGARHAGDDLYIEVITTRPTRTSLSGVVGQDCWLVSTRAVARLVEVVTPATGTPYPAVLAGLGCNEGTGSSHVKKAFDQTSDFTVYGDVVSNGGVKPARSIIHGTVTWVDNPPNNCGTDETSGSGWTGYPISTLTPYPKTYTLDTTSWTVTNNESGASTSCTYSWTGNASFGAEHWETTTLLKPGVYCATGNIAFPRAGAQGNVTFVSTTGAVTNSHTNVHLTAYWDDLLLYTDKGGATTTVINWSGGNGSLRGIVFAPNGNVRVSGTGNETISGAIWGKTVTITGAFTLDSRGFGGTGAGAITTYRAGTLVE